MSSATAATGIVVAALVACASAAQPSTLVIPQVKPGAQRFVTLDDMMALRVIDTLSVSPDGRHFAIFVRQAERAANEYRAAWFVGETREGNLTFAGDGGKAQLLVRPSGHIVGEIAGKQSRWSPDGEWLAYTLTRDGQTQLWRSRVDGRAQQQLTHNAADVREFAWSSDRSALYFSVGTSRDEKRARDELRSRAGYRYDEDLWTFTDLMGPQLMRAPETDLATWIVAVESREERLASASESEAFARKLTIDAGGAETGEGFVHDAVIPPVMSADGDAAWLVRARPLSRQLHVMTSASSNAGAMKCTAEACSGAIKRIWWSADARQIFVWRGEGINEASQGIYSWSPRKKVVATVLRAPDDQLEACELAAGDQLICIRETKTQPAHVAGIDLRSGKVRILADVNPEFRNIRLGRIERYEWDSPTFEWNEPGGRLAGLYAKRAYGYILYPPDFDHRKRYPAFIEPYVANGFDASVGAEHSLHLYAANGFIVLNLAFPQLGDEAVTRLGGSAMKESYSAELDFPHLSMFMNSTVRGLDAAIARGFIDPLRIGIGGVSHGTFVPLYLMQKYDRIAAASISSPSWGPHEYYWGTRKNREAIQAAYGQMKYEPWQPKPEGAGREFWRRIDIADHVEAIEAPILMHLSAAETYGLVRFIRHLADEEKPYDAYLFEKETHLKWQPAHLAAIRERNLDWFRFWLQDYEDPAPAKADQYLRWKKLRKLQCQNSRSLRDYCAMN